MPHQGKILNSVEQVGNQKTHTKTVKAPGHYTGNGGAREEHQFGNGGSVTLSDPLPADNWSGKTGFIHQVVLDDYLDKHPDPTEIEFYMCGPPMMNNAVNKMLYDIGVEKDHIFFDDFGI